MQVGKAPDQLIFTTTLKNERDRKRVVCAYPQVSFYGGHGSIADPSSFVCRAPA